eukprot:Skav228388  [mRNA]  locus=scaffold1981:442569:442889:+ [translate_table: standard]
MLAMEDVKPTRVPEVPQFEDPHVPSVLEVLRSSSASKEEMDEFDSFEKYLLSARLQKSKEERQMLELKQLVVARNFWNILRSNDLEYHYVNTHWLNTGPFQKAHFP